MKTLLLLLILVVVSAKAQIYSLEIVDISPFEQEMSDINVTYQVFHPTSPDAPRVHTITGKTSTGRIEAGEFIEEEIDYQAFYEFDANGFMVNWSTFSGDSWIDGMFGEKGELEKKRLYKFEDTRLVGQTVYSGEDKISQKYEYIYDIEGKLIEVRTTLDNNQYYQNRFVHDTAGRLTEVCWIKDDNCTSFIPITYDNGIKTEISNWGKKIEYRFKQDGRVTEETWYESPRGLDTPVYEKVRRLH